MRKWWIAPVAAALLASLAAAAPRAPLPPAVEIANVEAFARLYGVVRYFHPGDGAAALDWNRFAVLGVSEVRTAPDPRALGSLLRRLFAPLGPGIEVGERLPSPSGSAAAAPAEPLVAWRYLGPGFADNARPGPYRGRRTHRAAPDAADGGERFPESPPVAGSRVEFDLGSGLKGRVRTVLADREAKAAPDPNSLEVLKKAVAAVPGPSAEPSVDQRLADVVVAWNALRHFYPYWSETGVGWDAHLAPQLESARVARSRADQHRALRLLVAAASDGHGSVSDTLDRTTRSWLPLQLKMIGGRLAVSASSSPEVPAGAVVRSIDGVPAVSRLKEAMSLQSGTEAWRAERAAFELARGPKDSKAALAFDDGAGPRTISLSFAGNEPQAARRPEEITELEPGVWYVDLTRVTMERLTPVLEKIASARGVVFDLRGYPLDAGMGVLRHLLAEPESDRWMHVAKIVGPFGEVAGWQSFGWDVVPATPRIAGKVVFLTDGSAISYAESVMGYVADRKLGTIVGSRTAGTNGNVASFPTPGGFRVHFTGMRVTGHDGKSVRHLAGIQPDVAATPTVEGLRAGRDEVLERGLREARREFPGGTERR